MARKRTTQTVSRPNPYRFLVPTPDTFYGTERRDLVAALAVNLWRENSAAVVGGRLIGKSTLLLRLRDEITRLSESDLKNAGIRVLAPYLNLAMIPLNSANDFFYALTRAIAPKSPRKTTRTRRADTPAIRTLATTILKLRANRKADTRVVFLLDEADRIFNHAWSDDLLGALNYLLYGSTPEADGANAVAPYVSVCLAGGYKMYDLMISRVSPIGARISWAELRAFDLDSCSALIREPARTAFSGTFCAKAYETSGGHPAILQYVMKYVYDRRPDASESLIEDAANDFLKIHNGFFAATWRSLPDSARDIYEVLVAADILTFPEIMKRATRSLLETETALSILMCSGLINHRPIDNELKYWISNNLFRRWVASHIGKTNTDQPPLVARPNGIRSSTWGAIEDLEIKLRRCIENTLDIGRSGVDLEGSIRQALGDSEYRSADDRRQKNKGKYYVPGFTPPTMLTEYLFLLQLGKVIVFKALWPHFSAVLEDSVRFWGILERINLVRQDLAHQRPVPTEMLEHCRIDCSVISRSLPVITS